MNCTDRAEMRQDSQPQAARQPGDRGPIRRPIESAPEEEEAKEEADEDPPPERQTFQT